MPRALSRRECGNCKSEPHPQTAVDHAYRLNIQKEYAIITENTSKEMHLLDQTFSEKDIGRVGSQNVPRRSFQSTLSNGHYRWKAPFQAQSVWI